MPCFSMALLFQLTNAGLAVKRILTTAKVHFEEPDGGWSIHRIDLDTEAPVSNVATAAFEEHGRAPRRIAPVASPIRRRIHLLAKVH